MVQRLGFSAFTRKARVRHPVWEPLSYEYFIHICISYIRHERIVLGENIPKLVGNIPKLVGNIPKLVGNIPKLVGNIPFFRRYRSILGDIIPFLSDIVPN